MRAYLSGIETTKTWPKPVTLAVCCEPTYQGLKQAADVCPPFGMLKLRAYLSGIETRGVLKSWPRGKPGCEPTYQGLKLVSIILHRKFKGRELRAYLSGIETRGVLKSWPRGKPGCEPTYQGLKHSKPWRERKEQTKKVASLPIRD